jgi:hypothetical protein
VSDSFKIDDISKHVTEHNAQMQQEFDIQEPLVQERLQSPLVQAPLTTCYAN